MKISELLKEIEYTVISGDAERELTGLSRDNRKAEPGDFFICTEGARFDTHDGAVLKALSEQGVVGFLTEKPVDYEGPATVIKVEDTRKAGAFLYAAYYGYPAREMTMIAVTGSKGKTTTTHMLATVLREGGRNVGTIGTNGVCFNGETREIANTTPDYDETERTLREMADAGVDTCVLEVSSQAMKKHRVDGILFDYGVFLNIQKGDHIGPNEHESFEDYLECKAAVLNHSKVGLIHLDDPYVEDYKKLLTVPYIGFGSSEDATYRAIGIEGDVDTEKREPGVRFQTEGALRDTFRINFPGDYNVWNALAAIAVADKLGIQPEAMKRALTNVHIKGRNDVVYRGAFRVCVDFAHNGESTWAHLKAMREYKPKRLIAIFGADGNRTKDRRYGMGEAAGTLADLAIVTSGHNRFETFEQILADTEVGLRKAPHPNYIAIKDRKEAIRYALRNALPGDFITVLGLGHEHWQEENGVKTVYNDEDFIKQTLREMGLLEGE